MSRRVLIVKSDGAVEIMEVMAELEADALVKWKALGINAAVYVSHREIAELSIPTDRIFRNAWEDNDGIKVNMPKAREIHKNKLRELRKPLLEALDMDYMRADEQNDQAKKNEIATKKQALRDVTDDKAIESAQTPEQLKAVIPDILK